MGGACQESFGDAPHRWKAGEWTSKATLDVPRDGAGTFYPKLIAEWQGRPLDTCYLLVFFDTIRVGFRDEGFMRNKAVYIALGTQPNGTTEVLGN